MALYLDVGWPLGSLYSYDNGSKSTEVVSSNTKVSILRYCYSRCEDWSKCSNQKYATVRSFNKDSCASITRAKLQGRNQGDTNSLKKTSGLTFHYQSTHTIFV